MSYPERVWVGPAYFKLRVLVLGESLYGDFPTPPRHVGAVDGCASRHQHSPNPQDSRRR